MLFFTALSRSIVKTMTLVVFEFGLEISQLTNVHINPQTRYDNAEALLLYEAPTAEDASPIATQITYRNPFTTILVWQC